MEVSKKNLLTQFNRCLKMEAYQEALDCIPKLSPSNRRAAVKQLIRRVKRYQSYDRAARELARVYGFDYDAITPYLERMATKR